MIMMIIIIILIIIIAIVVVAAAVVRVCISILWIMGWPFSFLQETRRSAWKSSKTWWTRWASWTRESKKSFSVTGELGERRLELNIRKYSHTNYNTITRTHTHTYIYTHMYIHTHIHTNTHTHTHTHTHIYIYIYMRQYQKLSKFWQGKNIKTSVFRTCILLTQNTEQVLRVSELLSVIQNSYIYGNHGNFKMELTLPVPSCY